MRPLTRPFLSSFIRDELDGELKRLAALEAIDADDRLDALENAGTGSVVTSSLASQIAVSAPLTGSSVQVELETARTRLTALETSTQTAQILELDWSSLSTQAGIGDGNVSAGGVTWVAANTAAASLFEIRNGEGLKITAASGVSRTYNNTTQTSPVLYIPLSNFTVTAVLKHQLSLWIWTYFSTKSLPTASNAIIAGLYGPSDATYTAIVSAGGFINNAGTVYPLTQRSATFTNAAMSTAFDVIVYRYNAGGSVDVFGGTWSSGWPTALTLVAQDLQPAASTIVTGPILRRDGARIIYTPATRTAAAGSPSFTIARTLVQVSA